MNQLTSLEIDCFHAEPWIANEFLDLLMCYDLPQHGLEKLFLSVIGEMSLPFEEDVLTRLANMCPSITHLQLSEMKDLSEEGRL